MTEITDKTEAELLQAMSVNDLPPEEFSAYAGTPLEKGITPASKEALIEATKTVSDPEIMINVYDMGLIYDIEPFPNGDVLVKMSLTAPACPVAGILPQQVADALASVEGVGQVEVKVVWEPAWTIDRMTEDAKLMLNIL